MTDKQNTEIHFKIKEFEKSVIDFIQEDELTLQHNIHAEYSNNQIRKCIGILNKCLESVEKADSNKSVKRIINFAVIRLNILHVKTKFLMIETMVIEDIADILNQIAYYKGAIGKDYDQTEKFRIW